MSLATLVLHVGELELAIHRRPLPKHGDPVYPSRDIVGIDLPAPAVLVISDTSTASGTSARAGVGAAIRSRAELAALVAALSALGELLPYEAPPA